MLTYEDWIECGENERVRTEFILRAIAEHEGSPDYREAVNTQKYYDGENPTIMTYEKIIYDMLGRAHVDMWSANHKIATQFFKFAVDQEVAYLLGNGIRFSNPDTKKRLGGSLFDARVMKTILSGRVQGQSFGFWNLDHVDMFKFTEFSPIYGEENGSLMLGLRDWQLDRTKPRRITLYELDGYTEYIRRTGEDLMILQPKRPYKVKSVRTAAEGTTITNGENYPGFPIVPFYANEAHNSAIHGKRNTIDALDLLTSGMVNNCSEGELIYWVLTNCGGMDEIDDARFIEQLRTTRVTHADGDAGAKAEAHTVEAPVDGNATAIKILESRLYRDFQAYDPEAVTASNQSATAIRAAYVPLDLKCDIELEPQVTEFVKGILKLAGIDDEPTYQRNRLINETEETQKIIMQAEHFDEDYIRQKLLTINGDIDMLEDINKRMDAEDSNRLREAEARLRELENAGTNQEEGAAE